MTEAEKLQKILEDYKFIVPVAEAGRINMIESRTRVLKSVLKELGRYSLWYALVLFVLLKIRAYSVKISFAAAKIITAAVAFAAAAVIISGTYAVVKYSKFLGAMFYENADNPAAGKDTMGIQTGDAELQKNKAVQEKDENALVYEIVLYNGKIYQGIIRSRGLSYIVSTSSGRVSIPAKQIRLIKRVKE